MKLGPVTKLAKRNTATPEKFNNKIMSANCDVIVIFPIYGQFGAIPKPDSGEGPDFLISEGGGPNSDIFLPDLKNFSSFFFQTFPA